MSVFSGAVQNWCGVVFLNKEEIIRAIDYSACAYRDIQPYCEYNLIRMISEADFDVQYCLRSKGGELSITFRGTDSLINWITDFAFWEKQFPMEILNQRSRSIRDFCVPTKPRLCAITY